MAIKLQQGRVLAALSMTPLIDVVFLLLIFFLVASRLSREDNELDIPLPSAANALPMTAEPQEVVVNIDQDGAIFVSGENMDSQRFEEFLLQAVASNPLGQSIIVRAHRDAKVQAAVNVMDICLKCGTSYSFVTAEEEP